MKCAHFNLNSTLSYLFLSVAQNCSHFYRETTVNVLSESFQYTNVKTTLLTDATETLEEMRGVVETAVMIGQIGQFTIANEVTSSAQAG